MFYAPHKLQRKEVVQVKDQDGYVISEEKKWIDLGYCRCDDNNTFEVKDTDGTIYVPKYKVVFDKSAALNVGDYLRALEGDKIRGEGLLVVPLRNNYLNYQTVYLK